MRRLPLLLFAVLMAARVAAAQQPETIEYYGQDVMGSIRIAWDANGNVIGRHDYLPFGKPLFTNAAMPKEGFGGQEKDAQTDEGYFHARMLQFRLGRFGSPDPVAVLENPQTLNRYSYATNNPEALVDPEGALASSGTECTWVEVEVEGGLSAQLNCPLKNSGGGGSSVLSDFFDFLAWAALHTVDTLVGTVGVDGGELSPTPSTAYKPSPAVETALDTALLVAAVITPVKGAIAKVAAKEATALGEKAVGSALADDLAAAAARARQTVGKGRGPIYGTKVHAAFRDEVLAMGNPNVRAEVSFMGGIEVDYGVAGSVRLDAVQFGPNGQVSTIFDLKTGMATLTPQRILQIQQQVGRSVPVYVIRP